MIFTENARQLNEQVDNERRRLRLSFRHSRHTFVAVVRGPEHVFEARQRWLTFS
jgi:hypothetical protein